MKDNGDDADSASVCDDCSQFVPFASGEAEERLRDRDWIRKWRGMESSVAMTVGRIIVYGVIIVGMIGAAIGAYLGIKK